MGRCCGEVPDDGGSKGNGKGKGRDTSKSILFREFAASSHQEAIVLFVESLPGVLVGGTVKENTGAILQCTSREDAIDMLAYYAATRLVNLDAAKTVRVTNKDDDVGIYASDIRFFSCVIRHPIEGVKGVKS